MAKFSVLAVFAGLLLLSTVRCQQPGLSADKLVAGNGAARGRRMLASDFCPAGCAEDGCVQDATQGGLRCQKCLNNLLPQTSSGLCICVAGKYISSSGDNCLNCERGYWCPGGAVTAEGAPGRVQCPENTSTLGIRASSQNKCVNVPGTYYVQKPDGTVGAVTCPADTYSPGLKRQRACVPCPTGYTTFGVVGATSPTQCIVPAGFYLKAPGQVAPCPRGEYKPEQGINANCTKCADGVLTPAEGATSADNCTLLRPAYYALEMSGSSIVRTGVCPQNHICPGGTPLRALNPTALSQLDPNDPSVKACPNGTWTKEYGSFSFSQCLTPPGHFTARGATQICPDNTYRPDWKAPTSPDASSCTSCGMGVLADKSDRVTVFDPVTYEPELLPITTGSEDCYILPGQGLFYQTTTKTWRAQDCTYNNYGVANITYGLTPAPCVACPSGMIASSSATYPTSARYRVAKGFNNVMACVNLPGYGLSGRVSQPCDQGTYNEGDNYGTCKACPQGRTTRDVGVGKSISDCLRAPGYGAEGVCPIGTYNDLIKSDLTATCSLCPRGTTTAKEGSDQESDCQYCLPGFGGDRCQTVCGGVGNAASYGTGGRAIGTPCTTCASAGNYYSFDWKRNNDIFAPRTVARQGAISSIDCVSEYTQYVDGAWFLPVSSNVATTVTNNVATFQACVDVCSRTANCQFVTYDYVNKSCAVRVAATVIVTGEPWVGFKVVASGATSTNPWSTAAGGKHLPLPGRRLAGSGAESNVAAKAQASGLYSFYQDPNALVIGTQAVPANADNFTTVQDCLAACDNDYECAGVTIQETVDRQRVPSTCKLIKGDKRVGQFKRTVVRTDLDRLVLPYFYLCLGDRSGGDLRFCNPIATLDQVVFLLTVQTSCTPAEIQATKEYVRAYVNDPANSLSGMPTLRLDLTDTCVEVPANQGGSGRKLQQA